MKRWQSGVVEIDGLRLHSTRTGGDRPPLVLAHGFSENGLVWTALGEVLEAEYDVIMPDARGHGNQTRLRRALERPSSHPTCAASSARLASTGQLCSVIR